MPTGKQTNRVYNVPADQQTGKPAHIDPEEAPPATATPKRQKPSKIKGERVIVQGVRPVQRSESESEGEPLPSKSEKQEERKTKAELQKEKEVMREEILKLNEKLEAIAKENEESKQKVEAITKENEALKKQVEDTVKKVEEITKEKEEIIKQRDKDLETLAVRVGDVLALNAQVVKEKDETAVKLTQAEKERDELKDENEQLAEYKTDYDNIQEISKKLEFEEDEEPEPEPEQTIDIPLEEQKPLNEVEAKLEREFATAEQLRRGENKICDFHFKDIDIKKHLNKLNLHNVSGHMGMTEVKIKNSIDLTKLNENPWK